MIAQNNFFPFLFQFHGYITVSGQLVLNTNRLLNELGGLCRVAGRVRVVST